ncbi:MAG: diphthine--ammonia ligase [Candidatus Woesearchaeota archaeon]
MKLGVLFSGGKDSCLAWSIATKEHEVVCLITVASKNKDSYFFHTPNIELTVLQAEASGIPHIIHVTEGEKEKELLDLKRAIEEAMQKHKIEGIVTGAVLSVYQATRVQKICYELNLWCFNPLWLMDQLELLQELQTRKINAIIGAVASEPFDAKWLGRNIDELFIKDISSITHLANPAGEGGEFESFVIDMPLFKKKIEIVKARTEYNNYVGKYIIEEARLCEK